MLNVSRNRPAPLLQDVLNLTFGDISWALCYPDGSCAVGIRLWSELKNSEICGRAAARTRAWVLGDMGYEIVEHGWMKPRGVEGAGPVVVFRIKDDVKHAQR